MELPEALKIVRDLADGIDPHTGEVFPTDGPYQHPQVVRALYTVLRHLELPAPSNFPPPRTRRPKHQRTLGNRGPHLRTSG